MPYQPNLETINLLAHVQDFIQNVNEGDFIIFNFGWILKIIRIRNTVVTFKFIRIKPIYFEEMKLAYMPSPQELTVLAWLTVTKYSTKKLLFSRHITIDLMKITYKFFTNIASTIPKSNKIKQVFKSELLHTEVPYQPYFAYDAYKGVIYQNTLRVYLYNLLKES